MAPDLIEDDPKEPSSPACRAHEADDSYMGFAAPAEIAAFLERLHQADADAIRRMLPRIRDDVLHSELASRLRTVESDKSGA